MTKALAILNSMRELELKNGLNTSGTDAAIAELEEAMKPKTCEWCKLCDGNYCEFLEITVRHYFGCNQHEPKDTQ